MGRRKNKGRKNGINKAQKNTTTTNTVEDNVVTATTSGHDGDSSNTTCSSPAKTTEETKNDIESSAVKITIPDKKDNSSSVVAPPNKDAETKSDIVEKCASGTVLPDSKESLISSDNVEVDQLTQKSFMFFNMVEKIVQLLKSRRDGHLLTIIQRSISILEDDNVKKVEALSEVLNTVLENLEDIDLDYLNYYQKRLKAITLPKDIRKLFVKKNFVKDSPTALGRGAFGIVTKGTLIKSESSTVTVAIKEVTDLRFERVFIEEAQVMSQLDHENILKLLAITENGSINLVLEFMNMGDLVDILVQTSIRFSPSRLLKIIHDVAAGMEYLSDRQYVHRDLKCKNVFLNSNLKCKIGDFGLCKYVGNSGVYKGKTVRITGKHVAPESKRANIFTKKSDVWSMGALIWELYCIQEANGSLFLLQSLMASLWDKFMHTHRLAKVEGCPTSLHRYTENVILNQNPLKRPEFGNIKKNILTLLEN